MLEVAPSLSWHRSATTSELHARPQEPPTGCRRQECQGASAHSSPDFAQSVVSFWIGNDGLNGYDGFVDLRLQLPELLYMQQAENLSSFIEDSIWGGGGREAGLPLSRSFL